MVNTVKIFLYIRDTHDIQKPGHILRQKPEKEKQYFTVVGVVSN